jgi:hypothetical protein
MQLSHWKRCNSVSFESYEKKRLEVSMRNYRPELSSYFLRSNSTNCVRNSVKTEKILYLWIFYENLLKNFGPGAFSNFNLVQLGRKIKEKKWFQIVRSNLDYFRV